ncbi:spermine/spermidine acetyltransferase, partial [Bacillus subtilis]
ANECHYYKPVGLYYEGDLVGFAMYGLFPEYDEDNKNGRVWLDRFFIDERYQGKGLGKKMLKALIQHLAELYKCKRIYLSIFENNIHAIRLYQRFGFQFNGELDFNGEKVMVKEL